MLTSDLRHSPLCDIMYELYDLAVIQASPQGKSASCDESDQAEQVEVKHA